MLPRQANSLYGDMVEVCRAPRYAPSNELIMKTQYVRILYVLPRVGKASITSGRLDIPLQHPSPNDDPSTELKESPHRGSVKLKCTEVVA